MKIDYVKKDDEHKVVMRLWDDSDGAVMLLSVTTTEDGVNVTVVDHALKKQRKMRFSAGNTETTIYLPLAEAS